MNNLEEIIPLLKEKLPDYLQQLGVISRPTDKFLCPIHDDSNPSMVLNPKTGYQTAHCFSCSGSLDIFTAAALYENLPAKGREWLTETLPTLGAKFGYQIELGELSEADKERLKTMRLAGDIAEIISNPKFLAIDYIASRNWENEYESCSSISETELIAQLKRLEWTIEDILGSFLVKTAKHSFFGTDKITFTIRDHRGRAIGFISRNLKSEPKYINSLYEKGKILHGLDLALKPAKFNGLYIVEGPSDRMALLHRGITNVVSLNGTTFTKEHLTLLKMLGIRTLYFCLDWDDAGILGTQKVFSEVLRGATDMQCFVVEAPKDSNHDDIDSYLASEPSQDPRMFNQLTRRSAFEWTMHRISDNSPADEICRQMVPLIAIESAAVRRELLIKQLQDFTSMSYHSILSDVNSIREHKTAERRNRLLAAADSYRTEVERDPANLIAAMSQHEANVRNIEKDYERDTIGPGYQLSRYDAIQQLKAQREDGSSQGSFKMKWFKQFAEAMNGGMAWTMGVMSAWGGRANSGKTAVVNAIALDIAIHDEEAMVVIHSTDDSYAQIEPRQKTNISLMINPDAKSPLTIGEAASPQVNIYTPEKWALYNEADRVFRNLLADEKLTVIDAEDGPTMTVLERTMRYLRNKYPFKKMFVVCDNVVNYSDFGHLGSTERMTQLVNVQKMLAIKYKAHVATTAEYRKNMPQDVSKLKLPVNDDLADARALMYRPNLIVHVYNDINDRGEDAAEWWWVKDSDPDVLLPKLRLIFAKNKLSKFKQSLWVNLDTDTVAVYPVKEEAPDLAEKGIQILRKQLIIDAQDTYGDDIFDEDVL